MVYRVVVVDGALERYLAPLSVVAPFPCFESRWIGMLQQLGIVVMTRVDASDKCKGHKIVCVSHG